MKRKTLLVAMTALLSLAMQTKALEFADGHKLDPEKTYYEWCYMWHGRVASAEYHGTAYTFDYCTYDPYEKNGKTYNSMLSFTDAMGWIYLVNLDFPKAPGIRTEDGRIYVDREEYIAYLEEDRNKHAGETVYGQQRSPIGDRDYIPYRQTADGELVLYDFNMRPGDKFTSFEGHEDISVASVSTMTTRDGVERRLLTLSNGYEVLEGIGCLNSPGMFFCYLNPSDVLQKHFQNTFLLSHFRADKELFDIYRNGDHLTGIEETAIGPSHTDGARYDLQGRRLSGTPRRGLYISGGRKLLVK